MLEVNAEHALVKKLDGSVFHDLAHPVRQAFWPKAACQKTRQPTSNWVNALLLQWGVKWLPPALMDKALAAIELIVFMAPAACDARGFSMPVQRCLCLACRAGLPALVGAGFPKPVRGRAAAPALAGPVAATRRCNGRWLPHPRPWRRLPAGRSAHPGWTGRSCLPCPQVMRLAAQGFPLAGLGGFGDACDAPFRSPEQIVQSAAAAVPW